jgi:hypothetical protein
MRRRVLDRRRKRRVRGDNPRRALAGQREVSPGLAAISNLIMGRAKPEPTSEES